MDPVLIPLSKKLSHALRHNPARLGLTLDKQGWASVSDVLTALNVDMPTLATLVATNDKKRFAFSSDQSKIRCSQGHTFKVDLGLRPTMPPAKLYHGTQTNNLISILKTGLLPMRRQHVHLSKDKQTAEIVGKRRPGTLAILTINAERMHSAGHKFYVSENGVWLTDEVPAEFITFF